MAVPGAPAEYPYYAPLGALLAMYPTVAGTVKLGLQTIAGLSIGIVLAYLAVWVGDPNWLSIAFVVGMGVLLAGTLKRTAGGGSGIASAGLFVLIIGNTDLGFSLGYFIQTIIGVSVGLAVSAIVVPPLHIDDALGRMGQLRRAAARQLQELGEALEDQWAADDSRWAERRDSLTRAAQEARSAVAYAAESRKANIRRRFHPRDVDQDYHHVGVLEIVAFHTLNITNMLQDALHGTSEEKPLAAAVKEPMRAAFAAVGDVLELWTVDEHDGATLATAQEALRELETAIYDAASRSEPFGAAGSVAMSLHRILHAVTPDLRLPADT